MFSIFFLFFFFWSRSRTKTLILALVGDVPQLIVNGKINVIIANIAPIRNKHYLFIYLFIYLFTITASPRIDDWYTSSKGSWEGNIIDKRRRVTLSKQRIASL